MQKVSRAHMALSDDQWTEILKSSVSQRVIDGVTFPGFPPDAIQAQFVGSANANSLAEAAQFYKQVKAAARALGTPFGPDSSLLDFGCGWGRFLRFFWRDVEPENLHGVDVDPTILATCADAGIQANLHRIDNLGRLPLPDRSISHVIAYSVFTHLPEQVHMHWLAEIARVAKPGAVFVLTTEPRRFLDFIAGIPADTDSAWHAGLRATAGDIDAKKRSFDAGDFVYIPTGGGDYRDQSVYGDAVVPRAYLERAWRPYFRIHDYIDDPKRFWQAVVVAQRV